MFSMVFLMSTRSASTLYYLSLILPPLVVVNYSSVDFAYKIRLQRLKNILLQSPFTVWLPTNKYAYWPTLVHFLVAVVLIWLSFDDNENNSD